ncbi:phage tail protein [Francisella philomiragia]|uniref:Phage P2 GpU family protein n=1 Tax=Francisella philomiragia TaxID=28110 RepID=A0A0B6D192_9GAMM|nr:phage tail protein [Francisella philomiragia]AJI52646.1 phage P2 GpU family protein [Francisella philomiragia]
MITIGEINFNLKKQYITSMGRKTTINYAELKKLNNKSTIQYTGESADVLTINCETTSKNNDINKLRETAKSAKPQLVQDASGIVGEFVILSVNEKFQYINQQGARVVQFDLELKKYER